MSELGLESVRFGPEAQAVWDSLEGFDLRPRLGEIQVPTLVIAGAHDQGVTVERAREMAEALPEFSGISPSMPMTIALRTGFELPRAAGSALASATRQTEDGSGSPCNPIQTIDSTMTGVNQVRARMGKTFM